MQRTFQPITPQKKQLPAHSFHQDSFLKELSPLIMTSRSSNPGKLKLQMMHSPLPTAKDLFSQLIASQVKGPEEDPYQRYQILEEDSFSHFDEMMINESESESGSFEHDELEFDVDENGMKKRKRKSTTQLKVLKKELQQESNWDKDKIAEMAEATGLSQAQVYKWWWDQKKKNIKHDKQAANRMLAKKKMIKKPYSKRSGSNSSELSSDEESEQKVETKAKNTIEIEWNPETAKKINKRLTFN